VDKFRQGNIICFVSDGQKMFLWVLRDQGKRVLRQMPWQPLFCILLFLKKTIPEVLGNHSFSLLKKESAHRCIEQYFLLLQNTDLQYIGSGFIDDVQC